MVALKGFPTLFPFVGSIISHKPPSCRDDIPNAFVTTNTQLLKTHQNDTEKENEKREPVGGSGFLSRSGCIPRPPSTNPASGSRCPSILFVLFLCLLPVVFYSLTAGFVGLFRFRFKYSMYDVGLLIFVG